MKISLMAVLVSSVVCTSVQAEPEKAVSDISANISLVSDYRYRGISQTRLRPAIQGGVDYVHNPSGLYVGGWASTMQWIKDTEGVGNTSVETDFYGGRRGELATNISYDVGLLAYVFVNNGFSAAGLDSPNTLEAYAQLGWGPAYIKYNHAVTTLFGYADSKNSGYLDIGASLELPHGFGLNLHAGHQKVHGIYRSVASYSDYKIGVTREIGGIVVNLSAIHTTADRSYYVSGVKNKYLAKDAVVLALTKTF